MLKVGFMGTQSTGKSTRAKALSKEFGFALVTEAARSCPLPINKRVSRTAQLYIYSKVLQLEIEQMTHAERYDIPGIVCDRTLLDPLVYSFDRGFTDLVDLFLPFTRKWMVTYTKLFWCRPAKGSTPEVDGVRCSDWIWQKKIDRKFETFIQDVLCLNVEVIDSKDMKCPSIKDILK